MAKQRILAVDDSPIAREMYSDALGGRYQLELATDGDEGWKQIQAGDHDLYLLDLLMPGRTGVELQRLIREHRPEAAVVVISQTESVDDALAAFKERPDEFLRKPVGSEELRAAVERALEHRRLRLRIAMLEQELSGSGQTEPVQGLSPVMRRFWRQLETMAGRHPDATVLFTGESGTGKEVAARALHRASARRRGPFIAVNCGLLDSNLAASELFGIERNVATGVGARPGKIEVARGGTLFLDEVAELSEENQIRLLRVLQERTYTRVGSHREVEADVRVVAATNRDLRRRVEERLFREDLFFRLCVVPVEIPPLRDRREDIPELAAHFLAHGRGEVDGPVEPLTPEELSILRSYDWPGNVRQLQNTILRRLVLGRPIRSRTLATTAPRGSASPAVGDEPDGPRVAVLGRRYDEIERDILQLVLEAHDGSVLPAARALGIGKTSFYAKIQKYGLRGEPDGGGTDG